LQAPALRTQPSICTRIPKPPFQSRVWLSAGLTAGIIFAAIFILLTRILPDRGRIDVLVRSASRALLFQRFDHFLISSENPDIIVMGSSISLVPSQWADVAAGAVRYSDLVAVLKRAYSYKTPSYFLACLEKNGFDGISVIHLGMPTANVTDQLLMLQTIIGFGKTPKLVVMTINPRDCLVLPSIEYPVLGSPIFQSIKDIRIPPKEFVKNRIAREALIGFRKSAIHRCWEAEQDYFAYEATLFADPLLKLLDKSYPFALPPRARELPTSMDLVTAWTRPSAIKLDTTPETIVLANYPPKFLQAQCKAVEDCAVLLKKQGIQLLLVEVPLYPGIRVTESARLQYDNAIETACLQTGARYYRPADSASFCWSDFSEILHMNAYGGYKLYSNLATYMRLHRAELFHSSNPSTKSPSSHVLSLPPN
jgi:hypothetical protein